VVNVSGPNQVPVPSEHPNNDLLADLAAEVLPDDLAGHVQDHVMVCGLCAGLLADAEGVRQMLLQVEPEQMPDEVLIRIERALLTARREDEAALAGEAQETRLLNRVPPLGAEVGRGGDPTRRIIARGGNPAAPATGPMTGSLATGPKTGRLSRMSAPAQSARRQAIEEQKADRPSLLSRAMPALKIAAVLVVIGGAGVGALQLRGSGSDAADTTAAGAADAGPPIVTPVQSSTTNYLRDKLSSQVKSLIATSQEELQSAVGSPEGARSSAFSAEPSAAAKAAQDPAAPEPLASPQGQLLRSPEALQACLKAIGAAQVQPVAVDLARYGGREAAIIVLPADGGGVDVWVVARDCKPGSDGTIDVVNNVKP
jgi:hypothetical protein